MLGNEGHGMRTNILRRCDHLITIGQQDGLGSTAGENAKAGAEAGADGKVDGDGDSGEAESPRMTLGEKASAAETADSDVDSLNVSVAGGIVMHHLLSWQRFTGLKK